MERTFTEAIKDAMQMVSQRIQESWKELGSARHPNRLATAQSSVRITDNFFMI